LEQADRHERIHGLRSGGERRRRQQVEADAGDGSVDAAFAPGLDEDPARLATVANEVVGPFQAQVGYPADERLGERNADRERKARERRIATADPALERDRESQGAAWIRHPTPAPSATAGDLAIGAQDDRAP